MDAYDNYAACTRLTEFVDALSNWYVRRSRDRFWSGDEQSADKLDAYWTLYECLLTTSKLIAPFVPFLAEAMWQNLAGVFGDRAVGKRPPVRLSDWPTRRSIDEQLSERMALLREIVSLGPQRADGRQAQGAPAAGAGRGHPGRATRIRRGSKRTHALMRDELNVKQVEYTPAGRTIHHLHGAAELQAAGPAAGQTAARGQARRWPRPTARQLLAAARAQTGKVTAWKSTASRLTLDSEDIQVRLQAKDGWAAAQGRTCVVVLSTELTHELIREGLRPRPGPPDPGPPQGAGLPVHRPDPSRRA